MRIKWTMVLAIMGFGAAFVVFVAFYENRVRALAEEQVGNHAAVIASSLWTLEKASPTAYLTLAAQANGYLRIWVTDEKNAIFVDIRGPGLQGMDRLLNALNLIPLLRFDSDVVFEDRMIGRISALCPLRTIYLYLYIILCIALFLITMLLFLKLHDSNKTLEIRVRDRTAALERENAERRRAEEELRAYSQRLSLHVQHTPLGVIEWDLDLRVLEWNSAAERIFGYTRAEALGRGAHDLIIPPAASEQADGVWKQLLDRSGGRLSVSQNRTKDGQIRICEWYNTALTDEQGAVIGVASLVQDITERKRIEEALRLTQFCFDRASIGIFRIEPRDGRIQDVNEQACRSLGYSREELCALSVCDIDPKLSREQWVAHVENFSGSGSA